MEELTDAEKKELAGLVSKKLNDGRYRERLKGYVTSLDEKGIDDIVKRISKDMSEEMGAQPKRGTGPRKVFAARNAMPGQAKSHAAPGTIMLGASSTSFKEKFSVEAIENMIKAAPEFKQALLDSAVDDAKKMVEYLKDKGAASVTVNLTIFGAGVSIEFDVASLTDKKGT